VTMTPMRRLDSRRMAKKAGETRVFVAVRNEQQRLACFLSHYRALGVDRFYFADNLSSDGTIEYLLAEPDCHVFSAPGNYFLENIEPPRWTNALANVFGDGEWCLTVDADELFVYPHCTTINLKQFCGFLDHEGSQAVATPMVDMYGEGAVAAARYREGTHFLESCPYFDPNPGWIKQVEYCPGWQMFGGVRERVFWHNQPKAILPPCISKVPLVKWRKGKGYLVSMHFHSGTRVSQIRGALLHFKFLSGFTISTNEQVAKNRFVMDKTLGERAVYIAALAAEPNLTLMDKHSVRYTGPDQLQKLGWMRSQRNYDQFALNFKKRAKQ
jgi:hypothetical protein